MRSYNFPAWIFHRDVAIAAPEGCAVAKQRYKTVVKCKKYTAVIYLNNIVVTAEREEDAVAALREIYTIAGGRAAPLEDYVVRWPDGYPQYTLMSVEYVVEVPREAAAEYAAKLREAYGPFYLYKHRRNAAFYVSERGVLTVMLKKDKAVFRISLRL
ncbi:MAG: hypothetical protein ABWU84_10535 [Pyrobaculum sp.]|uniref:hypothetical protein n=1 Tax=Pyrobaculum sp. TaxID=2004705 RepID=UPI003EF029E6